MKLDPWSPQKLGWVLTWTFSQFEESTPALTGLF